MTSLHPELGATPVGSNEVASGEELSARHPEPAVFERRRTLPAEAAPDAPSLLGTIIKKSLGKELGTVSVPISLAEPLSLLQRLSEQFSNSELLDQAARISTSVHSRMVYIAAFVVASLASQAHRTSRKPLNPLLGETFELLKEDKGFRFLAEKTVHHPTTIGWICESTHVVDCGAGGRKPLWTAWEDYNPKSRFRGTSIEVENAGSPVHVTLRVTAADKVFEEEYVFMPSEPTVSNIISGTKDLVFSGELEIINLRTRELAVIDFEKKRRFTGRICNSKNVVILGFVGCWDTHLNLTDPTGKMPPRHIWKAKPFPPDFAKYYGFTYFAMELNEITPVENGKLPGTDSRFRPDQRLLENGHLERAEEEKQRLEADQRTRRKETESRKETWRPRWFALQEDKSRNLFRDTKANEGERPMSWQYAGGYWEAREAGWQTVAPLPKIW